MLIVTKSYGWTVEDIHKSCPTDTLPYVEAYQKECEEKQAYLHLMGVYVVEALRSTVGNMFAGKGHKPYEYPKKPYGTVEKYSRKQKAEQFFAELNVMKTNFELSKKEKENERHRR